MSQRSAGCWRKCGFFCNSKKPRRKQRGPLSGFRRDGQRKHRHQNQRKTEQARAGDAFQRPLRSRFQARLRPGVAMTSDVKGWGDIRSTFSAFWLSSSSCSPSAEAEPGRHDGGSCCSPWLGYHLPCVRRVPASVSARGCLAASERQRGLHHTGAAPLPMEKCTRFLPLQDKRGSGSQASGGRAGPSPPARRRMPERWPRPLAGHVSLGRCGVASVGTAVPGPAN